MFRRTIERELADAQALHGRPAQRRQAEADRALRDGRQRLGRRDRRVDARRGRARTASRSRRSYAAGPLVIDGDRFALGRVYRNLITNAIQATAAGRPRDDRDRRASATTSRSASPTPARAFRAERLAAIFDDFVTTKRRGLGLGLAISKRIVEQLDGTIAVESEVGRGTAFTLRFPARDDRIGAGGGKLIDGSGADRTWRTDMFRTLVKTDALAVEDQTVRCGTSSCARCAARGATARRSCSAPGDRIILDDDSVTNLEARTTCLVPATLYSRMLARAHGRLEPSAPRSRAARSGGAPHVARSPLNAAVEGSRAPSQLAIRVGAVVEPRRYLRGSTASLSCFAIRALTTVLAGILIASPVAGLRPMRALRF